MDYYAGIDVSLEQSNMCIVDASGKIVREAKVASAPEVRIDFFRQLGLPVRRIGRALVTMAAWRAERGRVRGGPFGNAPCEGGALGDGGEERP
jgi:hypothetical protein